MVIMPGCSCCDCGLCEAGSLPETVTLTPSGFTGCLAQFNGVEFVLRRGPTAYNSSPCVYSLTTSPTSCSTLYITATFEYKGPSTPAVAYFSPAWWDPAEFGGESGFQSNGQDVNATATTNITDCSTIDIECQNDDEEVGGSFAVVGGGEYVEPDGVVFPDGCMDNVRVVVAWRGYEFKATAEGVEVPACSTMEASPSSSTFTDCAPRYPTAVVLWDSDGTACGDDCTYVINFSMGTFGVNTYDPCFKWGLSLLVRVDDTNTLEFATLDLTPDGDVPIGDDGLPSGEIPLQIAFSGGTLAVDPPVLTFERILP